MLEDLIQEAAEHLESRFYEKKFYFSYSSISKLLYSPQAFYQTYIMKFREERTEKYLIAGRLIHCLLLNEQDFGRDFIVSPTDLPKGKLKELVDTVYHKRKLSLEYDDSLSFEACEDSILETMIAMNYYQKLTKDKDRLSKVITAETKNYWDFLKQKGNKELIDEVTVQYCQDAVDVIKETPGMLELLGQEGPIREVHNELFIRMDIEGYPFGLQGIVDNLIINHQEKVIIVNDFKTSAKNLKDFPDSVEFYNYWMQAVIYLALVENKYQHLLEQGYQLKFNFIVIDKYLNVYAFPLSVSTLLKWKGRFLLTLDTVMYHYENNRYQLPHAFDIGSITL